MMMKVETQGDRGFRTVKHPVYEGAIGAMQKADEHELRHDVLDERILTESSAVGDYDDAFEKAASSFLWIGFKWHLDRDEVQDLINIMQTWIKTGRRPHAD